MNCSICSKPVILIPSAKERAKKHGDSPESYTSLFPTHSDCWVAKRSQESVELMRRIVDDEKRNQVRL